MNVAFSSDNNYAPYLAVSILSVLKIILNLRFVSIFWIWALTITIKKL